MQNKKGNIVWNFFASVKLALFSLFILSIASIIGTIVPQNEAPGKYIELYGENTAKFFQLLDIPDMYSSWWFTGMLTIFCLNLTVCTIERLPHIWRVVTLDNLGSTKIDRLTKMAQRRSFATSASSEQAISAVKDVMNSAGWKKLEQEPREGGTLLFAQKGAWTRLGVIFVHVSILVIFTGSLIGTFFGYKASVMIPEGGFTDKVYESNSEHTPIPLGFTVRCNAFSLTYYDTGAPKEFRSDLKIIKDNKEILSKSIIVNDPLQYAGLTFYQSSYQPIEGQFSAHIINETTGAEQKFILVPRQANKWSAENITFGITNISGPDRMRRYRYKIWFSEGKAGPSEFWVSEGVTAKIQRPGATYLFSAKPRFATGLQVVKDPGVWTVYIGCGLMILGLIIIFYLSHRRIWIFISQEGEETSILVSGISNKNKIGFEKDLGAIYEKFETNKSLAIPPHQG